MENQFYEGQREPLYFEKRQGIADKVIGACATIVIGAIVTIPYLLARTPMKNKRNDEEHPARENSYPLFPSRGDFL